MEGLVAAAALGAVLLVVWLAATRREVRRSTSTEWASATDAPRLWTSAARCPRCAASAGIVSKAGEALWFDCLSCGEGHRRETKA